MLTNFEGQKAGRCGVGVVRVLVPAGGVVRVVRVDYCGDEAVTSDGFTPASLSPWPPSRPPEG
ncbi:hypothetical protein Sros01_51650 [Streptomyces roseochromogenus]|nr:hypothetical protein Sros01_51650 [Streptomyces roseochromogenus]